MILRSASSTAQTPSCSAASPGIGQADPHSIRCFAHRGAKGWTVYGCDGCCHGATQKPRKHPLSPTNDADAPG